MAESTSKSTAKKSTAKASAKKTTAAAKKTTAKKASTATKTTKQSTEKVTATASSGRIASARNAVTQQFETVSAAAVRVNGLVSPITGRVAGDDRVAALRSQVEGILRAAEKSGTAVRQDASKRFSQISGGKTLKVLGDRADKIQTDLSRVLEGQSARAQELIGQAREQVSALRP